jgi:hypothetical protein
MTRITYTALAADNFSADTFRAYMAHEYGQALEFGMTLRQFGRALHDAKHLAKRIGRPVTDETINEIFANARADRELMDMAA